LGTGLQDYWGEKMYIWTEFQDLQEGHDFFETNNIGLAGNSEILE
jgi:hypothetical protein